MIRIGIINVSDRASMGIYGDVPGKEARRLLEDYLSSPWECVYEVLPDEKDQIEKRLIGMADTEKCSLVLTTGGTGPSPRDVSPEATEAVCERMLPGFGEAMRMESFKIVPTSILSRQAAGHRGTCLILNLPGKPKAIEECLEVVFPAIPYCIELLGGPVIECNRGRINVFRPESD